MAIEAGIRRGYAARLIVIAGVCGVLGAWGVYDYAVAIPRKQTMHQRAELLRQCRGALETEQDAGTLSPEAMTAYDAVLAELNLILQPEFDRVRQGRGAVSTPQELAQAINDLGQAIDSSPDAHWISMLVVILNGLTTERRLPLLNYPDAQKAFEAAQQGIDQIGTVTAPGTFDRATQWAFILCLPCAPWFLWVYATTRRRSYRLEDDGTLHAPEGTWQAQDIAGIDMSRWMAKSIASVGHRDGRRIKLDDYRFHNLHLIVGSIASRLHPDQWDAQAKPSGKDRGELAAAGAGGAGDAAVGRGGKSGMGGEGT